MSDTKTADIEAEKVLVHEQPKRKFNVRDYIPPTISFGIFIALWCFTHRVLLADYRRFLLPYPWDIIRHGFTEKDFPKNPRALMIGVQSTMRTSLGGLLLAAAIGITLAIFMSRRPPFEKAIYPYAVALQVIPILALVPLIRLIFGTGYMGRTLVCVLIAVFPIIVNTLFGLKSPEKGMHDLFTLHGASGWTRLWKLQLPAALPAMFEGLRISAGLSVIGAVVGEFYMRNGPRGLGVLIDFYYGKLWYHQMYAAIFLTAIYGLLVFAFFGFIRNKAVGRWYNVQR